VCVSPAGKLIATTQIREGALKAAESEVQARADAALAKEEVQVGGMQLLSRWELVRAPYKPPWLPRPVRASTPWTRKQLSEHACVAHMHAWLHTLLGVS
jgi:hypothetical protein